MEQMVSEEKASPVRQTRLDQVWVSCLDRNPALGIGEYKLVKAQEVF